MNSFGRIFRISIFGESHGPMAGISIDGCPAGIKIEENDFLPDLERRRGGLQKGTTPRKEEDKPVFLSGIFKGHTTGAPITIAFENKDIRSTDYEKNRSVPRPGHADFVADKKFHGFQDYRGGGHFSGRLTVCLVAAGVVAKKILGNIIIQSQILELGGLPGSEEGIEKAIAAGDSVGGIVECRIENCPIGWGEPFLIPWNPFSLMRYFPFPLLKELNSEPVLKQPVCLEVNIMIPFQMNRAGLKRIIPEVFQEESAMEMRWSSGWW